MFNKIDISIEAYRNRTGESSREQPLGVLKTRHRPHGVIAVLGPFNFPCHIPNGHIIPALLAGNTVVFKPSEYTPLSAELTMKCWEKSGLPSGVINLIQGGRETGMYLSGNTNINGLFFTGSWNTGKILSEQFAKTPEKILALELGGNNPLVVCGVADFKAAALLTIQSTFITSGQRCSCARRLIVPKGKEGDDFVQELIEMIKKIKVGTYTDIPEPFMGPVISEDSATHLIASMEVLQSLGGKVLSKMRLLQLDSGLLSPGLIDVTHISNRQDQEFFGPLLQLIRVRDFDAALLEANNTAYGLSAGIISDKKEYYERFLKSVRAGVVNWNTPLTGASSWAPFGGIGLSGNHRPSAYYAADYCAYPVASVEVEKATLPKSEVPGISFT